MKVSGAERRWLAKTEQVLQTLSGEDPDDPITASAVEASLLSCTAECSRHLDIHPFEQFAFRVKDVDVYIRLQWMMA